MAGLHIPHEPMSDFITYHFKNCIVRYFPVADYLETVFPDGAKCPAQFTFKNEDAKKALHMGYTSYERVRSEGLCSAIRQMHLEHELAHTFIAEALGEPWCPVLRSVAVKGPCEGAWEREELVMAFQRHLNFAPATDSLRAALGGFTITHAEEFCRRFRP